MSALGENLRHAAALADSQVEANERLLAQNADLRQQVATLTSMKSAASVLNELRSLEANYVAVTARLERRKQERDEALSVLEKTRLERDAARRERDEVRAEVIPMLDDRDRWMDACIAAEVDHTTESYKAVNTLAARLASAHRAIEAHGTLLDAIRPVVGRLDAVTIDLADAVSRSELPDSAPRLAALAREGVLALQGFLE